MYIVMEIQNTATIVNAYNDRQAAEARYHTILAAAAVSTIETHSAVMFTNEGRYIKSECYKHEVSHDN